MAKKSTAQIGEIRAFAGRDHIYTEKGWKYYGKGGGKKATAYANGEVVVKDSKQVKVVPVITSTKKVKYTGNDQITALEHEVLENICNSPLQNGIELPDYFIDSFFVTKGSKELVAALMTCMKKGLVKTEMKGEKHLCCISQKGLDLANSLS